MKAIVSFTRGLWSRLGLDRSLFGRLMVAYTALVLVGLVVIGLLLSYLAAEYIREEQVQELIRVAKRVNYAVLQSSGDSLPSTAPELLEMMVAFLGGTLDVYIWLFDLDGAVIATSIQGEAMAGLTVPEPILERVTHGEIVTASTQLAGSGTTVLLAAMPLGEGDRISGGVLVYKPTEELNRAVARIRETILWVAFVVLLLALAVGSYLSWTIVRPLRQLRQVVADIGSGNYGERHVELTGSEDEIGELAAAIASVGDKLAREELRRREAEQSQRRLLADISHELRTPLTTIRGFVEALIDEVEDDPAHRQRYLALIHEQTLHLGRLVDDLLELSRLESEDIRLVRMPVRLDLLLQQVAERLSRRAEENHVAIKVVCECEGDGDGATVIGDPDRLEQVITNLAVNAIEVSAGGEVTLSVRRSSEEVELAVHDTGPGIDPADLPYIWERFYRGRSGGGRRAMAAGRNGSGEASAGHTGLGLAIVRRLVMLHGGRVAVDTRPGQGSTFRVSFPKPDMRITKSSADPDQPGGSGTPNGS